MNRNLDYPRREYPRRKFQEYADSGEIKKIMLGGTGDEKHAAKLEDILEKASKVSHVTTEVNLFSITNPRIGDIAVVHAKGSTNTPKVYMNISGVNNDMTDWKDLLGSGLPTLSKGIMLVEQKSNTDSTLEIKYKTVIQSGTF